MVAYKFILQMRCSCAFQNSPFDRIESPPSCISERSTPVPGRQRGPAGRRVVGPSLGLGAVVGSHPLVALAEPGGFGLGGAPPGFVRLPSLSSVSSGTEVACDRLRNSACGTRSR